MVKDAPDGEKRVCGSIRDASRAAVVVAFTPLPISAPRTGEITLGVRPEHMALRDDAPWRGEVSLVEPTGADTYVVVKTGVGNITVRVSAQSKVKIGDAVGLAVADDHVNWFDAATGVRIEG